MGVTGAGPGTICDNCDDNDILVCNVCVHTVSRVKTLNTRWWGSRGHWASAPPGSSSSPGPLSFLTQLRSQTTQPTVPRSWYKLNVIPCQGSVINYPPCLVLCCRDRVVSRFQSSFSPLPLSRQLSDLWRPAHHLDWITISSFGPKFHISVNHSRSSSVIH